jgi:hypothetical protein
MYLQKVISRKTWKNYFFVGVLKVSDEKKQDPDPAPHQNVLDAFSNRKRRNDL